MGTEVGCEELGLRLHEPGLKSLIYWLCDLSEPHFLICTVGMKELLHRVDVRVREDVCRTRGNAWRIILPENTPRIHLCCCGGGLSTIPHLSPPGVCSLHCCQSDPVNI